MPSSRGQGYTHVDMFCDAVYHGLRGSVPITMVCVGMLLSTKFCRVFAQYQGVYGMCYSTLNANIMAQCLCWYFCTVCNVTHCYVYFMRAVDYECCFGVFRRRQHQECFVGNSTTAMHMVHGELSHVFFGSSDTCLIHVSAHTEARHMSCGDCACLPKSK